MTSRKTKPERADERQAPVFDRAHLAHYTMNDEILEREVVGLFLTQLNVTIDMIETAGTAAEWRLWTHTLKGAAAAIGAFRLQSVALALENAAFDPDQGDPRPQLDPLAEAVAELRQHLAETFPPLAA